MLAKLGRDGLIYTASVVLTRGLGFILLPIYTRLLSVTDYGMLDLFLAFASLVHLSVALEISQGMARYYGENLDADIRSSYGLTAFVFTIFTYTLFFSLAQIFAPFLSHLITGSHAFELAFRVGLVYLWLGGATNLLQNHFRWDLSSKTYAFVSVLIAVTTAFFSIVFTYALGWGLIGLLLGMTCGTLCALCFCLVRISGSVLHGKFEISRLREMLTFSIPLVPSAMAILFTTYVDRVMLQHFLSLQEVGFFGVGVRISGIVLLVVSGFQVALTPLIYAHYREDNAPKDLARIFRYFVAVAFIMALALSLFAKEIIWLLLTDEYASSAIVVAYMAPAMLLSSMYILAPGVFIEKKTRLVFAVSCLGALLNGALNYLLIPILGVVGACVATLSTSFCVFMMYMALSQKFYPVPHNWPPIVGTGIVFAILLVLGHQIDFWPVLDMVLKLGLAATGCVVLLALRVINWVDICEIYRFVARRNPAISKGEDV